MMTISPISLCSFFFLLFAPSRSTLWIGCDSTASANGVIFTLEKWASDRIGNDSMLDCLEGSRRDTIGLD